MLRLSVEERRTKQYSWPLHRRKYMRLNTIWFMHCISSAKIRFSKSSALHRRILLFIAYIIIIVTVTIFCTLHNIFCTVEFIFVYRHPDGYISINNLYFFQLLSSQNYFPGNYERWYRSKVHIISFWNEHTRLWQFRVHQTFKFSYEYCSIFGEKSILM